MKTDYPMFNVDFNEMLDFNLVLLSAHDVKWDADGKLVSLSEGMLVNIYEEDMNESGAEDHLVASGVVTRNLSDVGWAAHVKWCCRIDSHGIGHQSEQ